jgi:cephalosporin hydroxylase
MTENSRVEVESLLPLDFANEMQRGVLAYTYKGIPALKCPMDMALYLDVLWEVRPGTVIEFGSNRGGSALWLADMMQVMGLGKSRLLSLDVKPVTDLRDDRIEFRQCDTNNISDSLPDSLIASLPRPLLVIDDASHRYQQVLNVLEFLHRHTRLGDYIIVEDGIISVMNAEHLHNYEGGPFQAIHSFLARHPDVYAVDRKRCDFFGRNVTWNCDGYLRRVA